jgi:drug/metabolite transporter (DMT)-like permease
MVFATVAIIFVRRLRVVNGALLVGLVGLLQLAQNCIAVLILGVFELPEERGTWGLLFGVGILSFASQMAFTLALKCDDCSEFAIVRTASDTLSAFILQFLVFYLVPDIFR